MPSSDDPHVRGGVATLGQLDSFLGARLASAPGLRIGVAKGRGYAECMNLLPGVFGEISPEFRHGTLPVFTSAHGRATFVGMRGADLPGMLYGGFLDVAIGSNLPFDNTEGDATLMCRLCERGRFSLITGAGTPLKSIRTVATRYPALTTRALVDAGVDARLTHYDGTLEPALLLGAADGIADIIETGRTIAVLKLVERVPITPVFFGVWMRAALAAEVVGA